MINRTSIHDWKNYLSTMIINSFIQSFIEFGLTSKQYSGNLYIGVVCKILTKGNNDYK